MASQGELFSRPTFGAGFLDQHAGRVISDVHFAAVELVANSWDAGADEVRIVWPTEVGGEVSFADNGTGMTPEEFARRWNEISYNRLESQGPTVEFPEGGARGKRVAFGRNGLGRHAMFYFADDYVVDTEKEGFRSRFRVSRSTGVSPFLIDPLEREPASGHGTTVKAITERQLIPETELADLIGSRFVVDPQFKIFVNGIEVTLTDLEHLSVIGTLPVSDVGTFTIRRFDSQIAGRTSKQSGVAWWVNRRPVGTPSWDVFDGPLLDARTNTGRRFVYVVEANVLVESVRPDWSGFYANPSTIAARRAVSEYVRDDLRAVTADVRKERKIQALRANRGAIQDLPLSAQEVVARFAEEVQVRSPTMTPKDLENAVQVLAQLEQSRSGYGLLEKLAMLDEHDLDALDALLDEWSVQDAKRVLDELHYRLKLIVELESLVEKHTTDELHDLQPLFERGLWIFGPFFESISFSSNRTLATVVRRHLGDAVLSNPRFRPDFVVLPDASIGVYSTDAFDENNEVAGLEKVVIIELKRGGHEISHKEKDQALGYAREIRKAGRVSKTTEITAYVLGTTVDPLAEDVGGEGATKIIPRRYSDVLRQAHARTFHLLKQIEAKKLRDAADPELAAVMNPAQREFGLSRTASHVDLSPSS
jgi:hypothetical protein